MTDVTVRNAAFLPSTPGMPVVRASNDRPLVASAKS